VTKTRNVWLVTSALFISSACSDDTDAPELAADAESAHAEEAGSPEAGILADAGSVMDGSAQQASADAASVVNVLLDASTRLDASPSDAAHAADAHADASQADAEIAVRGLWRSSFGDSELIDSSRWSFTSIVEYDNQARYAITQNPADDMFNPSKFNKYVWTPFMAGSFYYCTVDYGLTSVEAARSSSKQANESDLEGAGCGGFAWTKLSPQTEAAAPASSTSSTLTGP